MGKKKLFVENNQNWSTFKPHMPKQMTYVSTITVKVVEDFRTSSAQNNQKFIKRPKKSGVW